MSDALDKPQRTRAEAALDLAITELTEISRHWFGDEVGKRARFALDRIAVLLKETGDGDR